MKKVKLTTREEEIIQILWEYGEMFVKEVIEKMYEEPKPHYNTISTIIRLMEEKGFVSHKEYGNTYKYFAVLKKEDYRNGFMKGIIQNYFDNSYKNMVAHFVEEQNLSKEDLQELIKLIDENK